MKITDEIVAAASEAFVQHVRWTFAPCEMDDVREEVRVILEAALPLIIKDERQRIEATFDSEYVFAADTFPAGYNRPHA